MPLITQQDLEQGDDGIHFWIKYRPTEIKTKTGAAADFIDPHGVSGSLLWNTGILQSVRKGVDWSPKFLRPAGIVSDWNHEKQALRVNRLDVVSQVVRKMVATA